MDKLIINHFIINEKLLRDIPMQVKNLPADSSKPRPSHHNAAALEHLEVEANSNSNSNNNNISRGGNIGRGHSPGMLDSGVTPEGHQRKEINPNFITQSEEVLI